MLAGGKQRIGQTTMTNYMIVDYYVIEVVAHKFIHYSKSMKCNHTYTSLPRAHVLKLQNTLGRALGSQ